MLKTNVKVEKLTLKQHRVGDSKADRFGIGGNKKIAKMSRKSKSKKLSKSQ